MSNRENLEKLFSPDSMAIVGASNDLDKPGGRMMNYCNKHGFPGKLYPINPKREEIMGVKAYPKIIDVPGEIDVVCIMVPRQHVESVVQDCAQKKVKYIIIFSSGFAEIGNKETQENMLKVARNAGCRILGPNCLGVISTINKTIGSYHACLDQEMVKGNVGLIAQSGALGGYLTTALLEKGTGISHLATVGNESDLNVNEFIRYFATDPNTKVIGMLLEGIKDGKEFIEAAKIAIQNKKPIIILKAGKSEKGRMSALTHTGAITGSDQTYDGVFKQLGIIRVDTIEQLLDISSAFSSGYLPQGKRIAFISPSGLSGSMLADLCDEKGLEVVDFTEKTIERLKVIIPDVAVAKNPLDIVYFYGNPNIKTLIGEIIRIIADDPNVDIIISGLTVGGKIIEDVVKDSLDSINQVRQSLNKPVLCWWTIDRNTYNGLEKTFAENNVPLYSAPERVVLASHAMNKYSEFLKRGIDEA